MSCFQEKRSALPFNRKNICKALAMALGMTAQAQLRKCIYKQSALLEELLRAAVLFGEMTNSRGGGLSMGESQGNVDIWG